MASLSFHVKCTGLLNVASFINAIQRRKFTLNESKTMRSVKFFNILGYVKIRPYPERMRALQEFPVPDNKNALRRVLGVFADYDKWINCFATKGQPLA